MSHDPLDRLAKQRLIADSADIEAQLSVIQGCRPILSMMVKARHDAAQAMAGLMFVDPNKPEDIRTLQNAVRRYDDLIGWLQQLVQGGFEADAEITAEDREEMIDLLSSTPEGQTEAEQLGLIDPVPHDA